jgi:nicotinamidase-related amidase
MQPHTCALFVCDMQERFRPLIAEFPTVLSTTCRMIRGADTLGMPTLVTEQYPKGLGNTVHEVTACLKLDMPVYSKTTFSMVTPDTRRFLQSKHITTVIIVGIEAHVCVLQTVLELLELGLDVHVVVDGVSSSSLREREVAFSRMQQAGAKMCTSDMILFQLVGDSQHAKFKAISQLVTEPRVGNLGMTSML